MAKHHNSLAAGNVFSANCREISSSFKTRNIMSMATFSPFSILKMVFLAQFARLAISGWEIFFDL